MKRWESLSIELSLKALPKSKGEIISEVDRIASAFDDYGVYVIGTASTTRVMRGGIDSIIWKAASTETAREILIHFVNKGMRSIKASGRNTTGPYIYLA